MLGWLVPLLSLEICAELLLQHWAKTRACSHLAAGVGAYVALAFTFALAMRSDALTTLNSAWQCGNVVLVSLYGLLVLREPLTARQKVGVLAAGIAVFLVR